jgi:predicted SprT family Zn-dependent metalloprotease
MGTPVSSGPRRAMDATRTCGHAEEENSQRRTWIGGEQRRTPLRQLGERAGRRPDTPDHRQRSMPSAPSVLSPASPRLRYLDADPEGELELRAAVLQAQRLLQEHGLHDWTVGFDRAKRRAGACRFELKTITLSRHLTPLHPAEEVLDTILHEIAHALVGPAHGHDAVWRAVATQIGCSGRRCVPSDAPSVVGRWIGRCPAGHESSRHMRPERVVACSRCSSAYEPSAVITWTRGDVSVRMHPKYVAELVALADKHGGPAAEQLEIDALLGGGRDHPSVRAYLAPRIRPGTPVRVVGGRFEGLTGVLVAQERTRYTVQTPAGVLRIAPANVAPATADAGCG